MLSTWQGLRFDSITVAGAAPECVLRYVTGFPFTRKNAFSGSPDVDGTIESACEAVKQRLVSPLDCRHSCAVFPEAYSTMQEEAQDSPELEAALHAARAAGDISRSYYRGNFSVRTKTDRTPVTQADVECEEAIREIILARFPQHGFYGEETGRTRPDAEFLWLVDPIDGTKGFVRQYPFFSTQIALMRNGQLVLGVSNGVMFDELAWAEKGKGAWLNGAPLRVSNVSDISLAAVSTGNLKTLAAGKGWNAFGTLVASVDRIRGYGDFYQYHLLAAGKIEAVVESDVNILDIAALSVIVTEAGGTFTDLDGIPPGLETTSVLATNGALHAEIRTQLEKRV